MPERLVVNSVSSATRLRRCLAPGEAGEYGAYDGDELVVDDAETAHHLIERYPNVHAVGDAPTPDREGETVRFEADSDGVRKVDADDDDSGEGCPLCDEYDGEHVAQHASRAHPDEWDTYDG